MVTGNVPSEVNGFVGRERELARLRALQAETRLITLVGPGGVGKTRLALRLEAELSGAFPDGTWLVDLSPITDPALVPQALADVLGVRLPAEQSWVQELTRVLRRRRLLLVLDNCEHLVDACAELVEDLLRGCHGLSVLATSLQPLGAVGEMTRRVSPLTVPAVDATAIEDLRASEAVRLFEARVRAHLPSFTVNEQNAPVVGEICRRLDGLPLALELVSARVESLGVTEIAARLNDLFALVVGAGRTAPARHKTLEATLEWSWSVLDHDERALLRRLAVFARGWTLPAAEAVCSSDSLAESRIVDTLGRLVTKSLVVADHDQLTVRYRMLESVRAYALRQLTTASETLALQRRHCDYMLQLVERISPQSSDTGQAGLLLSEEDNLRSALEWTIQHEQAELGLRLAAHAFILWFFTGHYVEGTAWLDRLLALPAGESAQAARSLALVVNAQLRVMLGDYAVAVAHCETALAEQHTRADAYSYDLALEVLGNAALQRGDLARADALHTDSARRKREVGSLYVASNLLQLGLIAVEFGDLERARQIVPEVESAGRLRGEPVVLAGALHIRALVAASGNDRAAAISLHEQALETQRLAGDQQGLVKSLTSLGHVRLDLGQTASALAAFREAIERARASGERVRLIRALEGYARWIVARDADAAVRLAGATDGQRQALEAVPWPSERRYLDALLAQANRVLGQIAYERAWADGHASTLAQAVSLAEAQLAAPNRALTPREQEVAILLARGLTNKQVATTLVVSPATVRSHVEHILTKLDLRSRAQIAVWASQHGLLQNPTIDRPGGW